MMTSTVGTLALAAHVMSSGGWSGAVAGFPVLALAGLWSADARLVRGGRWAAYVSDGRPLHVGLLQLGGRPI